MASSKIWAARSKSGETTPGLKYVPIPAWENAMVGTGGGEM
jgi:hypothetical protein